MTRILTLFIYLVFFAYSSAFANSDEKSPDWNEIDRIGLYKTIEDGQIVKNIWSGISQSEAVALLDMLPNSLKSPAYRSVIQKILLSESKKDKSEIDAPKLLNKRISLLIKYGLFNDAQHLYQNAIKENDIPTDFGLAINGLNLSLVNGDVAPACLDIQVSSSAFRDMPAWRELSNFCKIKFGDNQKITENDLNFKAYPLLKPILAGSDVLFQNEISATETLIAFAENNISTTTYDKMAKNINSQSDLAITLATNNSYKDNKSYQCFVIESAKRGLKDHDFIKTAYEGKLFDDSILKGEKGSITIHPCDVPAFFYQRIQKITDEDKIKENIKIFMQSAKYISPYALTLFSPYLEKHTDEESMWNAAIIIALSGKNIPDSFLDITQPLKMIQNANQISKKDHLKWTKIEKHRKFIHSTKLNPARILYFSQIISGDFNNLKDKTQKNTYENFFSLTYPQKTLSLGLSFRDFMSKAYKEKEIVKLLLHGITKLGNHSVKVIDENDIAVILSALSAYKLEKETEMIVFESLHSK